MSQIEFKKVTKKYGDFKALDKVSLSIDKGDFVFIVGSSGAGKSTLVRLLIREEFADEGEVLVNGKNVAEIPYEDLFNLRRKIGVVFQDFRLLDSRSVYDNVAVALEVVNAPEQEIKDVVPNVLNMVNLSDKANYYPKQLSGGEMQRVSIARALAHEPDVLIADEPTGMIDPDSAKEIVTILDRINALGTTILMATHDELTVDNLKKRVVRIEKGKITSDKKGGKYRE